MKTPHNSSDGMIIQSGVSKTRPEISFPLPGHCIHFFHEEKAAVHNDRLYL